MISKTKLIALSLCLAVGALGAFYSAVVRGVKAAYVEWGAVEMIVAYCEDHEGIPPESIDDLKPYYRKEGNLIGVESFDELPRILIFDFDAIRDLSEAEQFGNPKPCFRRRWNAVTMHVVSAEWNLFDYFKNHNFSEQIKFRGNELRQSQLGS